MKYLKITTSILAVLSLSACLGSNSDTVTKAAPDVTPTAPAPVASYIDKQNTLGQLEKVSLNGWYGYGHEDTNIDMPTTGSANYAGIMELPDPSTDARMNGDLELTLDFDDASLAGIADNFSNSLDEVWTGQLVIEGDVTTTTIAFDVDGTLTTAAGLDTIVDLYLGGTVLLDDIDDIDPSAPEYIFGHLEGWMTTGSDWEEVVGGPDQNNEFFVELTD